MLYGTARNNGDRSPQRDRRNSSTTVGVGGLWYFRPAFRHSIQGLGPEAAKFILVFETALR